MSKPVPTIGPWSISMVSGSRFRSLWFDDVAVGDYVIVHVGYALQKLDTDEAQKTLEMFAQMAQQQQ